MSSLKKSLLLLLLPLFAFGVMHKFYLSVTQVAYAEKDESIQITSRIFIDDFEAVLKHRYGVETHLATPQESEQSDTYVEKYLREKFVLRINGQETDYAFLGRRYDNDILVCYLEVTGVPLKGLASIEVQNEILTDLFDEQKNIVHITINDLKRSFVLIKENNKGLLNL